MSLELSIKKRFSNFELNVSLASENSHEVIGLLGASGSGKSLTLKCLAGLIAPDEGLIRLNGRTLFSSQEHINLSPQERRIGYVPQTYALFPNMSIEKNIACGLKTAQRGFLAQLRSSSKADQSDNLAAPNPAQAQERVKQMLELFELTDRKDAYPSELSGGQQQRVALARCLISHPEIVLLDEPFSALDEYLRFQLERELAHDLARYAHTVLLVSHNRNEVRRLCDSVCVMHRGTTEKLVPVKRFFEQPKSIAAAKISGCKNIFPVQPCAKGYKIPSGIVLEIPHADPAGSSSDARGSTDIVALGIRSHTMQLTQIETQPSVPAGQQSELLGYPEPASSTDQFEVRIVDLVEQMFEVAVFCQPITGAHTYPVKAAGSAVPESSVVRESPANPAETPVFCVEMSYETWNICSKGLGLEDLRAARFLLSINPSSIMLLTH